MYWFTSSDKAHGEESPRLFSRWNARRKKIFLSYDMKNEILKSLRDDVSTSFDVDGGQMDVWNSFSILLS